MTHTTMSTSATPPKNQTLAAWLAVLLGSMGVHRFYLRGLGDWIGWLHPISAALGWWGVERVQQYGLDDKLSWVLIPFLGISIAAACLAGIVYALSDRPRWNRWFNPGLDDEAPAGATNWLTIGALVLALLTGTIAFMGSLAFGVQRYFEYQVEEARKISQ
ncbi:MAG: TM2 domain-containing protein [Burkholderiaceae bacterium]